MRRGSLETVRRSSATLRSPPRPTAPGPLRSRVDSLSSPAQCLALLACWKSEVLEGGGQELEDLAPIRVDEK